MTEHNKTQGATLNDNGIEKLKQRYEAQRLSAEGLLHKLQDERLRHIDIIADTRSVAMIPVPEDMAKAAPHVDQEDREVFSAPKVAILPKGEEEWFKMTGPIIPNSHAHGQMAAHLKIPLPYYKRMMSEAPDLLSMNVNRWMEDASARRMMRLRYNYISEQMPISTGRAYLSDRYRRLDLADLAEEFIPMLNDPGTGWQINRCGLTSLRMHIEAIMPHMNGEIRVGDEVALAVKITSSDVGAGALQVALGVHRVVCSNLAIMPSYTQRQVHLGRTQEEFVQLLSESTLKKEDELIIAKMRDVVASMANVERFRELLSTMQDSAQAMLPNPVRATEILGGYAGLKQPELQLVQNNLMTSGDSSVWGLANALTASVHNFDYERKHDLEMLAGKLLETPKDWKQFQAVA